jgi:hypothetical protein
MSQQSILLTKAPTNSKLRKSNNSNNSNDNKAIRKSRCESLNTTNNQLINDTNTNTNNSNTNIINHNNNNNFSIQSQQRKDLNTKKRTIMRNSKLHFNLMSLDENALTDYRNQHQKLKLTQRLNKSPKQPLNTIPSQSTKTDGYSFNGKLFIFYVYII